MQKFAKEVEKVSNIGKKEMEKNEEKKFVYW